MKPILAITMGDVNGVGPEILARALAMESVQRACTPVVYGDEGVLRKAAQKLGITLPPIVVDNAGHAAPEVRPGQVDPAAGACAVEWIIAAVKACQAGVAAGLVTCPISKTCIYQAGYSYTGHTELVADMTGSPDYRMCLFAGNLRAVHITSHLSLRDAIDAITGERIITSVRVAHDALARLGVTNPRIAVAGLNPHAGEDGAFGREEIEIVAPAVAACNDQGLPCTGPHPPDALFRQMSEGMFDLVVALYHDQGHIPLKLIAMDEGVNVTLGIPIVRTSVDHGTAFDIAWQGKARPESLCAAIELAARLAASPGACTPEHQHAN
jgi:4-hydroxythreonine-4-phosphate dehydrogenase